MTGLVLAGVGGRLLAWRMGAVTLLATSRSPGVRATCSRGSPSQMAPSMRYMPSRSTGRNSMGMEMDALMASKRLPLRNTTSDCVRTSVATAQ